MAESVDYLDLLVQIPQQNEWGYKLKNGDQEVWVLKREVLGLEPSLLPHLYFVTISRPTAERYGLL